MRLVTFSGPPSCGKTSVLIKLLAYFRQADQKVGVVKFDCLKTDDDLTFQALDIPVIKGLAGELCPDHYFATNIEQAFESAKSYGLDWLFSESAGLCNRCAPHIQNIPAICVIDQMAGIATPQKIGPMLKLADAVVVTKSDIVSQAEREVFLMNIRKVNRRADVFVINGLTGEGCYDLYLYLQGQAGVEGLQDQKLRFPMPMATCSYCLGEQRIGKAYQHGNTKQLTRQFGQPAVAFKPQVASEGEEVVPGLEEAFDLNDITIYPGTNKAGEAETFQPIRVRKGQVIALVGPTGSGKTRLLEDISAGVDGRGLTGRKITFDDRLLSDYKMTDKSQRLIAHLSQNMNFVLDLTVAEFIKLHLDCWQPEALDHLDSIVGRVLAMANELTGEKISQTSSLANLSGGQSRSLMIADCSLISPAPIMLIDEVENAGIRKERAIELLSGRQKIVLMSTHDPVLALMADYRFVIANGGIVQVLTRSETEQEILDRLKKLDRELLSYREDLRQGRRLS